LVLFLFEQTVEGCHIRVQFVGVSSYSSFMLGFLYCFYKIRKLT